MRGTVIVEAFAAEAPILGRIDRAFEELSGQMTIPAGLLAPGWPHRPAEPMALRAELVARQGQDESIRWACRVASLPARPHPMSMITFRWRSAASCAAWG